MYRVCEIYDRRAERKRDNVSLGGEHEGLVVEYICLERVEELVGVGSIRLGLDESRDPLKLVVDIELRLLSALVLPMRADTVFCYLVHLPGPYLNLERNTVAADDSGVERAVHIGLRSRDIVLKSSGHRLEHLVDKSERGVALELGIDDYSHRVEVIDLVKALILIEHLAVDTVYGFYSSRKLEMYVILAKLLIYYSSYVFDKSDALSVLLVDIIPYLVVSDRVEVGDTEIFELLLDLLHTETVCKRRVYVHSLKRGRASLGIGLYRECAHIVKSVAELDEDDSDVSRHREQHLTQIFNMCLLLILDVKRDHLCKSVDEHRGLATEFRGDLIKVGLIRAILHRVVKESGADRVSVKSEIRNYLGNRNRMRDIRISAHAELSLVERLGVLSRHSYLVKIVFSS